MFRLPDVGEGLTEAEIVRWRVAPGDEVRVNDPVVEIETAKAVVELPSPFAGRIAEILVAEGQVVPVGTPIVSVGTQAQAQTPVEGADQPHERESVLVGYGVSHTTRPRRRLTHPRSGAPDGRDMTDNRAPNNHLVHLSGRVRAKPPVRSLARQWGIDLQQVTPTGPHGDVTRADLIAHRDRSMAPAAIHPSRPRRLVAHEIEVRGVQRAMADAMVRSVGDAPHADVWVDVDVSGTLSLVQAMRDRWPDVRSTPLTVVSAAVAHAVHDVPIINSRWLDDGPRIAVHGHLNLGIAVDSPRGLVVPHIKDADTLGLRELAVALTDLTQRARDGHLTPADSVGGTFTITNVGVFGVDGGTPIINPGEVAILAIGRVLPRPWVIDGRVEARPVMHLSMSFDHRVVDGAAASRFLAQIAGFLADPATHLALA